MKISKKDKAYLDLVELGLVSGWEVVEYIIKNNCSKRVRDLMLTDMKTCILYGLVNNGAKVKVAGTNWDVRFISSEPMRMGDNKVGATVVELLVTLIKGMFNKANSAMMAERCIAWVYIDWSHMTVETDGLPDGVEVKRALYFGGF